MSRARSMLLLLLAAVALALATGCESFRCPSCPAASNEPPTPPPHQA